MPACQSRARPRLSGSSRWPAHTHTHTHVHAHVHSNAHAQARAHAHDTHTNTHAEAKRTRARTQHAHERTRTRTRTRTNAHPRTCTPRTHKGTPTRPHTEPPGRSTATAATASVSPDELPSSNPGEPILCAHLFAPLPGTARAPA